MNIRSEKPEDYPEIYDLVKTAFQTANVTNGKEQDLVNELRAADTYVPELALVAEENGKLIGHIMLSETHINDGSKSHTALYIAPLSVALEHRSKGIGSALIEASFKRAKALGYTAVVLVGDPAYYHRFGFKSSIDYGITSTHEIPAEYVMACELTPHALNGITGTMDCC